MDQGKWQKILVHCPLCQTAYRASEVRLLDEKGAARLFHCTCMSCGHAVMAIVLEAGGAVNTVGLVTDMEVKDALRFRNVSPINTDECLAMHRFLEEDSIGFCRLLLDKKA